MKNTLKRVMSSFLCVVLFGSSALYGAEAKPILNLNDAIESAYIRSSKVSLNSQENSYLKDQMKANENSTFLAYQLSYLSKSKNEQQEKIIKETIAYDITKRYNALVLLEEEIANLDANIMVSTRKLQNFQLQKKVGLVSELQYKNAAIQLDMQKNTRNAKQASLLNNQNHFKTLTGKDLKLYSLDHTMTYEPFRITGSVDSYFTHKAAEALKYDKEMLSLQADNLLMEGSAPISWAAYQNQKYQIDSKIITLEDAEINTKQALLTSYSSLLSLEEQIVSLQDQITLLENQLKILDLQQQVGLIAPLDYEAQAITLLDTKLALKQLTTNYNTLKTTLEKPWVASGSGSM